jgi:hypothetical protein
MRVNTYFLCFWLVFASSNIAQAQPDTLWTLRLRETGRYPDIFAATELANGDFAATGISTDTSTLDRNLFAARFSQNGQLIWMHNYGYSFYPEEGNSILELPDGNLVVIGGSANRTVSTNQVFILGLSGQGDSLWSRRYNGGGTSTGFDGIWLAEGNLAIVGYRLGVNGQHSDLWLLKCNFLGDTLWTRIIGGDNTDVGKRIVQRRDHGFSIAGDLIPSETTAYNIFLSQTDSLGNVFATQQFAADSLERCYSMAVDDASTFLAGYTTAEGDTQGYAVKLNRNGDTLSWAHAVASDQSYELLRSICILPEGGVFCAGWVGRGNERTSPWIVKLNPDDGSVISSWIDNTYLSGKYFGMIPARNRGSLAFGSIQTNYTREGFVKRMAPVSGLSGIVRHAQDHTPAAGVFVGIAGSATYTSTNAQGRYTLQLPAGTYQPRLWGTCISADTLAGIEVLDDSIMTLDLLAHSPLIDCEQTSVNLVVLNHRTTTTPLMIYNNGDGPLDYSVAVDTDYPASNWLSVSPPTGRIAVQDSARLSIQVRADTTDDNVYDYYGYIIIRSPSCPDSARRIPVIATVLDAENREPLVPTAFALKAPYPNPFNPSTTLEFSLPHAAEATLTIFDIQGRTVSVLANGRFNAGQHRVTFDGSSLASGVYTARLQSTGMTKTQKLLLLK